MKIFVVGDIFGRPGRRAIAGLLPEIVCREEIDFVVANAENAAGGKGLTPETADELFKSPIDVMTAGNHIWEHDTLKPYFDSHNILRPLNTKEKLHGRGWSVFKCRGLRIAVISLQGQIFMEEKGAPVVNPFKVMDELLPEIRLSSDISIVDFHAEATSEKRALAWYLDGRITALLGTHTHVQTADEEILPGGTAYISDIGMTGPHASAIGLEKGTAIHRFLTGEKKGYKVAEGGVRIEGVILTIDESTKRATEIRRVKKAFE